MCIRDRDGTVFRAPIMIDSIKPVVKNWKKPITIARHAYGDVYKCTEFRIPGAGKAELVFTGADGSEPVSYTHLDVYKRQRQDRQGLCQQRYLGEGRQELRYAQADGSDGHGCKAG